MSEQLPGVLVPEPHCEKQVMADWPVAWAWFVRAGVFGGRDASGFQRRVTLETGMGW